MMANAPADRYPTCQEVLDDLRAWQGGLPLAERTLHAAQAGRQMTVILSAPAPEEDLQPPPELDRLTSPRPWGAVRDWAATMFRRHAPEFIKELQTTTQWTDAAVAEYERRRGRLARLLAEAKDVLRDLEVQIQANRTALAEALRDAQCTDQPQHQAAMARHRECEDSIDALSRSCDEQKRQIADIELQLARTQAALARLRSQRDLLGARLRSAEASRTVQWGVRRKPPVRTAWLVAGTMAGGLLLLAWLLGLAVLRGALSFAPQRPEEGYSSRIDPRGGRHQPVPGPTEAEIQGNVFTNSIGMKLILVPAGTFMMGTDKVDFDVLATSDEARSVFNAENGPNEMPSHEVVITRPFYMGIYEVTQAQYYKVLSDYPGRHSEGAIEIAKKKGHADPGLLKEVWSGKYNEYPVDNVSFDRAQAFCQLLSERPEERQAGRVYRLPTEAEWEYACRAGTQTAFSFGSAAQAESFNHANTGGTRLGGCYPSNAFGLYDMHGNVWEWVADTYDPKYYASSPRIDPRCDRETADGIIRGGSFCDPAIACRSAFRGVRQQFSPQSASSVGFRVVCASSPPVSP